MEDREIEDRHEPLEDPIAILTTRLTSLERTVHAMVGLVKQNMNLGPQTASNAAASPEGGNGPTSPMNAYPSPQIVIQEPSPSKLSEVDKLLASSAVMSRLHNVEHLLRGMKGMEDQIIDAEGVNYFPEAKLPDKFKWPLEKFDGSGCPTTHLRSFTGILRIGRRFTDEQLGQAFQFSLSGGAHKWFLHLKPSQIKSWVDITTAFVEHYSYNTEVETHRRQLETIMQLPGEGFTAYLARFRAIAAQIWNRPSEREQVTMMMRGLANPYKTFIFGQGITTFQTLIAAGQQIEDAINHGDLPHKGDKVISEGSSSRRNNSSKASSANSFSQAKSVAAASSAPLLIEAPYPQRNQRASRQYTEQGLPKELIMDKLMKAGQLKPPGPMVLPNPLPASFRHDRFCKFHNQAGHDTEFCFV